MDKISVKFSLQLENGTTKDVVIKDLIESCTEEDLTAVANNLIENRGHYNGSLFQSLIGITKITTTEEKF